MPNQIVVTKRWSPQRYSLAEPYTAHDEWEVSGTTSRAEALGAVHEAEVNTPLSDAPALVSKGPQIVTRKGLDFWIVGADYGIPGGGTYSFEGEIKYRWGPVEVSEAVDVDLDGRPMCYANGEPVQGLSRSIRYKTLTVSKQFPFYNPAWSTAYENAVNKSPLIVAGCPVDAQHLRVVSIDPVDEYAMGTLKIWVALQVEIIFDDSLGNYPFQHRVMNQAMTGFASDGTRGAFFNAAGDQITQPVKLHADGTPLSVDGGSLLKVRNALRAAVTPTASPTPWRAGTAPNYSNGSVYDIQTVDNGSDTTAVIGFFKKTRIVDVSPLLQIFNG